MGKTKAKAVIRLNDSKLFAFHLRRICAEKNVTMYTMAKQIGIARSTLYRYFRGSQIPGHKNMQKLSRALRVPLTDFFQPMPTAQPMIKTTDPDALKLFRLFSQLSQVGKDRIIHAAEWEVKWWAKKRR